VAVWLHYAGRQGDHPLAPLDAVRAEWHDALVRIAAQVTEEGAMSIRRVVPNIKSDKLDECRDFYVGLLGFEVAMDLGWIVTFASPTNPTAQISIVGSDASSAVHPNLTVEVADVDAVHADSIGSAGA